MKFKIFWICAFGVLCSLRLAPLTWASTSNYPSVLLSYGDIEIENADGVPPSLKVGSRLRGHLNIKTGSRSALRIQIDPERVLFLEPESKINIPGINWESGEILEIQLVSGRIRLRSEKAGAFPIQISSVLFSQPWPIGDVVFELNLNESLAKLYVFSGLIRFSGLNAENSVEVSTGHKVSFQGQSDGGEITYDLLLKGRKIPRGQLSQVSAMTSNELKLWDLSEELKKQQKAAKLIQDKKRVQDKLGPGQICIRPKAKFNECSWVCQNNPKSEKKRCLAKGEGVKCTRFRCLAQGEWGDPVSLGTADAALRCQAEPVVGPCDY